jgi:hypothetical protein
MSSYSQSINPCTHSRQLPCPIGRSAVERVLSACRSRCDHRDETSPARSILPPSIGAKQLFVYVRTYSWVVDSWPWRRDADSEVAGRCGGGCRLAGHACMWLGRGRARMCASPSAARAWTALNPPCTCAPAVPPTPCLRERDG